MNSEAAAIDTVFSLIYGRAAAYFELTKPRVLLMVLITTLAGLRSIDAVGINLRIRVHPNSPVVVINTLVHARNVDYNPNS